ncbi:hypothetical protein HDU97_006492 [Phlyctochytrium planicorne]|nr:hypothetical protein HDU97_006492 [Phlyctochytrium planicorne]
MLLTVNLFWLILVIPATFLFAYVSSSGLYLLISAAKAIPRVRLIQAGILIALLFGTYAACFTPFPHHSLSALTDILRALPLIPTSLTQQLTNPRAPVFTEETKNWFRLPLPDIVQQTTGISHALCLAIGLFVVQWVTAEKERMKGRGVDAYQFEFVESFLGILFHLKFFLGTFLWYRYFLMPVSSRFMPDRTSSNPLANGLSIETDASRPTEITTLGASILGLSHTLAFSIGFFIHHDYHNRSLNKRSESEVMRYYLSFAGVLVAGRLAFQAICDATGLDPTSHDILLLSAAISCFILLNNKSYSLMNYFWLPLAAGLLSVIPALDSNPLVEFLMPYVSHNRERLALSLVGLVGFVLGVRWAVKPILSSLSPPGPVTQFNMSSFEPVVPLEITMRVATDPVMGGVGVGSIPLSVESVLQRKRAKVFPPAFPNGWYRVASTEEVGVGGVRLVTALGRNFAVFRGEDGNVGVIDAMCPHLGANVAVGGKVVGNSVECPFHGWRFDRTGKCTDIPYAATVPESIKTKHWPVREFAGIIVIYFDAEGREPLYEPRPFPLEGKAHYHVTNRTATLPMHIQDFAENAADWMHFGKVHSRLTLPLIDRFLYVKHRTRWSPSNGDDGPFTNDAPPFTSSADADPSERYIRAPDPDTKDGTLYTDPTNHHFTFFDVPSLHSVFSNVALYSGNVHARVEFTGQGGVVYFRFSTPSGEVTAVKTFLPISGGGTAGLMLHMRDDVYAERSVPWWLARHIWNEASHAFDDDIFLWCNKTYVDRPILVKEDRPVKRFREFYKRNYSPNSRTFAYEGIEW